MVKDNDHDDDDGAAYLETPKSKKKTMKLKDKSSPKSPASEKKTKRRSSLKNGHADGEDQESPRKSPSKRKSTKSSTSKGAAASSEEPESFQSPLQSPSKKKSVKKTLKTPKTAITTKPKVSLPEQAPNSAPTRRGSSKKANGEWWNLSDAMMLDLEDEEDEEDIAGLSPEEIQRRNARVHQFRNKYAQELQASVPKGRVAQLLAAAKQTQSAQKPPILPNVRAQPLDLSHFGAPSYKKNTIQKELIQQTAKENFVLKDLIETGSKTDIRKLVKAFENVSVAPGKSIVQQGDTEDDHFYVVESGTVEFKVDNVTVRTAGVGSTFGNANLLNPTEWKETIQAAAAQGNETDATPTKLLRLNHTTYRGIMQTTEQAKTEAAKPPPPPPKESEWAWLEQNSVLKDIQALRKALEQNSPSLDDLERIRMLGEGQFGEVWLVATEQHEFALKLQSLLAVEEPDKLRDNVESEIAIMKALTHPFVSVLYQTYDSEESMDMLLGLIPGGELWDVVHQEDPDTGEWKSGLPETHVQFYALSIADTLHFIHQQGYIFRDLKMENIMIDAVGYPMIVDFGFAKECPTKRYTFCGTPNYVAPEIIKNAGHDAAADWWALGIVIYEMVSGENPFYYEGLDQMDLYQSICEDPPEPLKPGFSKPVVDIVDKLLVKDPTSRLGSGKKRCKEILNHDLFVGLSLKRMRQRKIKAPWIPGKDSPHNFEVEMEEERKEAERERKQQKALDAQIRQAEEEVRRAREAAEMLELEKEAKSKALAEQQEADIRAAYEREQRRKQAEAEAKAKAAAEKEERLRKEAEAAAEEERLRAEAERISQEKEAAEKERLRLEAIEKERLRKEAEALAAVEAARKLREAEAAEEERLRLEAEAKAADEERLRQAEEAKAAEEERKHQTKAAEKERKRKEKLAEQERIRQETKRKNAEAEAEQKRLLRESKLQAAHEASEKERLREEAEARLAEEKMNKRRQEAKAMMAAGAVRMRKGAEAAEEERLRRLAEMKAEEDRQRKELEEKINRREQQRREAAMAADAEVTRLHQIKDATDKEKARLKKEVRDTEEAEILRLEKEAAKEKKQRESSEKGKKHVGMNGSKGDSTVRSTKITRDADDESYGEMSLKGSKHRIDDDEISLEQVFRQPETRSSSSSHHGRSLSSEKPPSPSSERRPSSYHSRSWNTDRSPSARSSRRSLDDELSPIEKGVVRRIAGRGLEHGSPRTKTSPRIQDELNRSIGRGLVAERLAKAKAKENELGGSLPSLFSHFQI